MLKQEGLNLNTPRSIINDAGVQFSGLNFFPDIDTIKKKIGEYPLETLEEFTGKSTEELNKMKPNICEKYNALIEELKSLDFTHERFKEIMKEAFEITHTF